MHSKTDFDSEKCKRVVEKIDRAWNNPQNRDGKWGGAILKAVEVGSIRGLSAKIELKWPITVIAGTNCSGKTTFLHACSWVYKEKVPNKKVRFAYSRWFPPPLEGETNAINQSSYIHFEFWNKNLDFKILSKGSKFKPVKRGARIAKNVEFISISKYVPPAEIQHLERWRWEKSEKHIRAEGSGKDAVGIGRHIGYILGIRYEEANLLNIVTEVGKTVADTPLLTKDQVSYTDQHTGAGEHKLFRLVYDLEELIEPSLILLEEPEVTLHPEVLFRLGVYLMDLCERRRHQLIITTHSPALFRVFPPQARVFLSRHRQSTTVKQEAESLQVERGLSGSVYTNKDLILVEDEVAKLFLKKILLQFNRLLCEQATIVNYGSKDQVREAVKALAINDVRVVGVRDPDVGEDSIDRLLSLPGKEALECLLLESENRKRASSQIDRLEEAYNRAESKCTTFKGSELCKKLLKALSSELKYEHEDLLNLLIEAWLRDLQNKVDAERLVNKIRKALAEEKYR